MHNLNDLKSNVGTLGNYAKGALNQAQNSVAGAFGAGRQAQKSHLNNFLITTDTVDGYEFVETSQNWKDTCSTLPCFTQCWWADYLTAVVQAELLISGMKRNVIIQLWKGWCQRLGGRLMNDFPGGIGAEVGVYEIVDPAAASNGASGSYWFYEPTKKVDVAAYDARKEVACHTPSNGVALPRQQMLAANSFPPGTVWYPIRRPYPWISFTLTYDGQEFFQASPQQTYWRTRWMDTSDYRDKYAKKNSTPPFATQYTLHYKVAGHTFPPW